MTRFKHLKGTHLSIPSDIFFNIKTVKTPTAQRYGFAFNEGNKYVIEGVDQLDFNKLLGLKGKILDPKFDTVMVGWRYRPDLDVFEVIPYFHLGSAEHHFDESKIVQLKAGEVCYATIVIQGRNVNLILQSENGSQSMDCRVFSGTYKKFGRVASWFGGNCNCPCAMTIEVKIL
jgi:hypothetical protein